MRFWLSVSISLLLLVLLGGLLFGASRQISPILIQTERETLVGLFPLVQNIILENPSTVEDTVNRTAKLVGVDITILNSSRVIEATSLGSGTPKGGTLSGEIGGDTVFQVVSLNGKSSFVLSSPIKLNGDKYLVLSKPDELLGSFLDELLTILLVVFLVGVALAIGLSYYFSHGEKALKKSLEEAFSALLAKNYRYRLGDEMGTHFSDARIAFNKAIEELEQLNSSTDAFVRSRLRAGDDEARAFRAALASLDEGIFIIDHLGKIAAFNAKMESISGFKQDFVLQKAFSDVLSIGRKGAQDQLAGLIPRILSTGIPEVFPDDTFLKRQDGSNIPVSIKTIPVKNELRSGITHVVVVVNAVVLPPVAPSPVIPKPQKVEGSMISPLSPVPSAPPKTEVVSRKPETPRSEMKKVPAPLLPQSDMPSPSPRLIPKEDEHQSAMAINKESGHSASEQLPAIVTQSKKEAPSNLPL